MKSGEPAAIDGLERIGVESHALGRALPVLDPAEVERKVDLGVELQAPRALAVAEGLVLALLAAREMNGPVGQVEDVEMPLVDAHGLAQVAKAAGRQRPRASPRRGSQPTSGRSAGRASAPSARASTWPPRQIPSTGTPSSTASRRSSRSRARYGSRSSSHDCIEPPSGTMPPKSLARRPSRSPSQACAETIGSPRARTTRPSNPSPGSVGSCSIARMGFTGERKRVCTGLTDCR